MDRSQGAGVERRRDAVFRRIEHAAFELFVARGYASVTAEHMAAASDISVRTFYRYFPEGKEGVILRQARAGVQDLVDALRRRPPQESATVALREAILEVAREWNSSEPALGNPSFEVSTVLSSQIAMQDSVLLARLVGERVLLLEPIVEQLALRLSVDPTADVRPRLVAHAVNAAVTAAWFTTRIDPDLDWVNLIEESLDVLERGLVPSCLRAGAVGMRPADVA